MSLFMIMALISAIPSILLMPITDGLEGLKGWGEMAADVFDTLVRIFT